MGQLSLGDSNGCWIDVFDRKGRRGSARRLYGPADFPFLRVAEPRSSKQIRSLTVGPMAYIQCYDNSSFHETVFWLLPNQRINNLDELEIDDGINSLRLYDRPPFAHEPGYTAYMLWAASHIARAGSNPRSAARRAG